MIFSLGEEDGFVVWYMFHMLYSVLKCEHVDLNPFFCPNINVKEPISRSKTTCDVCISNLRKAHKKTNMSTYNLFPSELSESTNYQV